MSQSGWYNDRRRAGSTCSSSAWDTDEGPAAGRSPCTIFNGRIDIQSATIARMLSFGFLIVALSACSGVNDSPILQRVGKAAHDAASHPITWGGLSAGLAFGVAGVDDDVSDWIADERPIFQKTKTASDASDIFRNSLFAGMGLTAVFGPLPAPADDKHAIGRRFAANAFAYSSNHVTTERLKEVFGRERPNEQNDRSLPSGHTSDAFQAAASIESNLSLADQQSLPVNIARYSAYGMAGATAWARMEARKHFPSDVLVGAALGNFLSRFAFGVIEGTPGEVPVSVELDSRRVAFTVSHRF